jgi:Fur family ferric uptake transcriptional regulator
MDDFQPLRDKLALHLRTNGLKNTRQRQVILESFLTTEGHMAVEELLQVVQGRMSGVGHATIYRTMKLFTEAGIADERRFGDGQTRYEPVIQGEHHDHLICEKCGLIVEFEDLLIEDRQELIAKSNGFQLTSHRHDIFGICLDTAACDARQKAK